MIQIIDCEQGTPEWFAARLGIPTASRFSDVLAKGQGTTRRKYMMLLAGEILTGEAQESYSNAHMERGKALEDEARQTYGFMHDADMTQVGFILNDGIGYSPDALIGTNGLLEVKTKLPHLQIECLLSGEVPSEHTAQIQGGLMVAEREWLDFVSYWPGLPLFVKKVYRDETYIKRLGTELALFREELSAIVKRIRAM